MLCIIKGGLLGEDDFLDDFKELVINWFIYNFIFFLILILCYVWINKMIVVRVIRKK